MRKSREQLDEQLKKAVMAHFKDSSEMSVIIGIIADMVHGMAKQIAADEPTEDPYYRLVVNLGTVAQMLESFSTQLQAVEEALNLEAGFEIDEVLEVLAMRS